MIGRWTRFAIITAVSGAVLSCTIKRPKTELGSLPAVEIQDIRVTEGAEKTVIEIEGEEPMIYTTFRLSGPDRLVIDMAGVSLGRFTDAFQMNQGPIRAVRPVSGGGNNVSRLEFVLKGSVETDVRTDGLNLVVEATQSQKARNGFIFFDDVPDEGGAPEKAAPPVTESAAGKPVEEDDERAAALAVPPAAAPPLAIFPGAGEITDTGELPSLPKETEKPISTATEKPIEGTIEPEDEKVDVEPLPKEKVEPLPPATKVTAVRFDRDENLQLIIEADGELAPRIFYVDDKRLVLDFPGVKKVMEEHRVPANDPLVEQVRMWQHPRKLRLVLDLFSPIPYSWTQAQGVLKMDLMGPSAAGREGGVDQPPPPQEVAEEADLPSPVSPGPVSSVSDAPSAADVPLEKAKEGTLTGERETPGRDEIAKDHDVAERTKPEALPAPLLGGALLPSPPPASLPAIQKPERTEAPKEPEKKPLITPLQASPRSNAEKPTPEKPSAEAVATPVKKTEEDKKAALKRKRREKIRLKRASLARAKSKEKEKKKGLLAPPQKQKYTGRKISLDFQDADISNVIRLIADVSKLNFVMGEDVKGKITLKVTNVPWDQALDIILKIHNLGKVRDGNIIRIATLANLSKQRDEEARAKETKVKAEDLSTRVVYVNYGKAKKLSALLQKLLSPRGEIMVADRVNALIAKDITSNLDEIEKMAKELDTKTPQVLIEARIVEVKPTFKQSLGVQWGADFKTTQGGNTIELGNPPGSPFTVTSPFSVNLPANDNFGGLGFTFGRLTQSPFTLDLRLSAGETQGMTRIVSTPKIMVLDNHEALIEQGESIPFQTSSQNEGTKTEFVDANLKLKVTPHISPDGGITLDINLTKNERGDQLDAGIAILKKEVTTRILLMNTETMVIGGIYETKKFRTESGIPLLKDIPFLGWLFKKKETDDSISELLVFLTPTIMD